MTYGLGFGVGAKLDAYPLLFFTLRGIDPSELIKKSVDEKMKSLLANAKKKSKRVIADKDAARIFGVLLVSDRSRLSISKFPI